MIATLVSFLAPVKQEFIILAALKVRSEPVVLFSLLFPFFLTFDRFALIALRFDVVSATDLLPVVFLVSLSAAELLETAADFANLCDKVHVISHDLKVVSFMDLTLDLETFLKRVHRVLQELLLVFIL